MDRKILFTAGILGMTAILFGAFGAHALKEVLTSEQLNTFETGVKYQMYHSLFLIFLGMNQSISEKIKKQIFILISFGTLLFSFSIYLLATMPVSGINFKPFGIVTPIGGLLLIIGWLRFSLQFLNRKA
jgi:uncharacterized membrane protein YgdD (TMEM256/DUF423 family)